MAIDYQKLRIEGIYRQNEAGDLMQRIKLPAGVLSAEQAGKICDLAERFSNGRLHLTTRGSIEIHWLRYEHLATVQRMLAAVGLTSRGACGGAVRGISCSSSAGPGFVRVQGLVARLQRHFTGNPHFEGLPKKFKLAVESGYAGSRHLIQDLALVMVGEDDHGPRYDIWLAGGLGREPRQAFLYRRQVPEAELLPIIEAVVRIYRSMGTPGKRLKHLLAQIGEASLRQEIASRVEGIDNCHFLDVVAKNPLTVAAETAPRVEVVFFAGELGCGELRQLAALATTFSDGFLLVSADQNLAFYPPTEPARTALVAALESAGFFDGQLFRQVPFRICPGSHECRLGLAPTRDVAEKVLDSLGPVGKSLDWAISGCLNSCAQPQLATLGIIAVANRPDASGQRRPVFDLYRRQGDGFGQVVASNHTLEQLLEATALLG